MRKEATVILVTICLILLGIFYLRLEKSTFNNFVHYNQLILSGLTPEVVGYDSENKEFKVVLDENKEPMFEEGLEGLSKIVIEHRESM